MKMTFRWYGAETDPITLENIRQIPGVSGIMGAMDWIPVGEMWSDEEISSYVRKVNDAGLECEVIESVNVHEDIKLGKPSRDIYIANYCKTLENLAAHGIKVVVYNFMPVFDWLRTELFHRNEGLNLLVLRPRGACGSNSARHRQGHSGFVGLPTTRMGARAAGRSR